MKRLSVVAIALAFVGLEPCAFAKTRNYTYPVSCNVLWTAVKDAVRNSGKYGIIAVDNEEMTISYNIGGFWGGKRINSAVLNRLGENDCQMQIQTAYSGVVHNDQADFKQRVDEVLARAPGSADMADKEAAEPKDKKSTGSGQSASTTPEAKAAELVRMQIASTPAGAEIELDGDFVGSTPTTLSIHPGDHIVLVKKKGHKIWERKLKVGVSDVNLVAELERQEQ